MHAPVLAAAWSLLVVLLFAMTPREAWHACFDDHHELAHSEGATISEHCSICDVPAPLAAQPNNTAPEQLRVLVNIERGAALLAPAALVRESSSDRGPPTKA